MAYDDLCLPSYDPRFHRRVMDVTQRRELLDFVGAALEGNPHAMAFFVERELLNFFGATMISDEDAPRDYQLREVRAQAERLGVKVRQIYFDPDDPTRIVIEPRQEIRPPV